MACPEDVPEENEEKMRVQEYIPKGEAGFE